MSDYTCPESGFGERLRHDRMAAGLTQEELAERSGLSVRGLSDLERGRVRRPRRDTQRRLAAALLTQPQSRRAAAEPGGRPVAGQLPPDLADFTGRRAEVDVLTKLLGAGAAEAQPGAVVIAAITGAGGVGKTALAVHAAHQVAGKFPDGQLYLALNGSGAQPVTPADALGRILRDLGMEPESLPGGEAERAARYRTMVGGMKLLVVLDDAFDATQVRPLLPASSGCAVLVTSRRSLASLESAHFLGLDVLDDDDASALFASVIGPRRLTTDTRSVGQVLATCAGLPLAIRIAAVRLATRPAWTIATLAGRLEDARQLLDELQAGDLAVRACFTVSYQSLGRDSGAGSASRFFRLLSLAEGPDISLAAAAALAGTSSKDAESALELLVDVNMLQSPAPGRYRFHDLLRAYAAERARDEEPPGERKAAIRRMLHWYQHTAARAARIISPARPHVSLEPADVNVRPLTITAYEDALAWLDAEHANLVAAVAQAASHSEHEVAWTLPLELWDLFQLRSHVDGWIKTHKLGLASASVLGDFEAQRKLLNNLGAAYLVAEQLENAADAFQRSLDLHDRAGSSNPATLLNLGLTLTKLGRMDEAADLLSQARNNYRLAGQRGAEGAALVCIGAVLRRSGQPARALAVFQQAFDTARDEGLPSYESDALVEMTEACLALGEFETAVSHGMAALEMARRLGYRENEAMALEALGRAQLAMGDAAPARALWRDALAIFGDLGRQDEAAAVATRLQAVDHAPQASRVLP